MDVQREVITKVVHHLERGDDGALLQVDYVDRAVALARAVEARGQGVVAPEIYVADNAAGRQAFDVMDMLMLQVEALHKTLGPRRDKQRFVARIVGDAVGSAGEFLTAEILLLILQGRNRSGHEPRLAVTVRHPQLISADEGDVGRGKALLVRVGLAFRDAQDLGLLERSVRQINLAGHVVRGGDERALALARKDVGPVQVALRHDGIALDDPGLSQFVAEGDPAHLLQAPIDGVRFLVHDQRAMGGFELGLRLGRHRDELRRGHELPEALARHLESGFGFDGLGRPDGPLLFHDQRQRRHRGGFVVVRLVAGHVMGEGGRRGHGGRKGEDGNG